MVAPGKWDFDDGFSVNHWLDGSAFMYKFNIEKDRVDVMSRFLDTVAYKKVCETKRPVYVEFGTKAYPDQGKNVISRFFSHVVPLELSDNVMGNVYFIDDELYASSETCHVWKIDPKSLKCIKKVDLRDIVSVNLSSSHPHICPDGSVYNLCASFMTGLRYHIIKMPPPTPGKPKGFERASILTSLSSSHKTTYSYYHSFGLTEHYVVFLEQPLLVNTVKMATSGIKGYCVRDSLEWTPSLKTKFHVIDRNTGEELKIKYQAKKPFFFFHHVNAYEEDGHIIVDVHAFPNPDVMDKYFLKCVRAGKLDGACQAIFTRFVLPLKVEGKVGGNLVTLKDSKATAIKDESGIVFLTPETKGEPGYESPTINYSMFNTKKYRYVYGSGTFDTGKFANSLLKLDILTEEIKVWKETSTMFPSELVYVPKPGSTEEDDGILLAVVLDVGDNSKDFVMVMDAKTFKELGRAYIPRSIKLPPSVHGRFRMN
ncbi:beta,beta-carotene 9',10'-oxygenase [Trichonephila inaurata madagascariensis]|uniref:Beta,beta-carotene 9',10'-oxygenase n=1 Tax=Trichonephila inaurata madagascariensis TaxID=2747483 RepID=A0A8X7BPQ0_9ARAC|nr:beta,beta-carotene 9',10'-oxygenase [Trichonephila inaurata madagascariensis]